MLLYDEVFPSHVKALTSGRTLDFGLQGDQSSLTEAQKEYLQNGFGNDVPEPMMIRQVHGDKVIVADEAWLAGRTDIEEADGIITNLLNVPLAVRTADCLPVFLCDPVRAVIGLVHAGWKGSRQKIVRRAVELMMERQGSEPGTLQAAFGPAIGPCCYEVGEEFKDSFPEAVPTRDGHCYLDLPQVNAAQLRAVGILEKNIHRSGICTCCDQNYFSYRRDGKAAGRMISMMMLTDKERV